MTPGDQVKEYGIRLIDVADRTGKPRETIARWCKDEPELFDIVCRGTAEVMSKRSTIAVDDLLDMIELLRSKQA